MTDDQIAAIGDFCESLMRSEYFNFLCETFKQQRTDTILATQPEDVKARETAYSEVHGAQAFLGLMHSYVIQRDQIRSRDEAAQEAARNPIE